MGCCCGKHDLAVLGGTVDMFGTWTWKSHGAWRLESCSVGDWKVIERSARGGGLACDI